MPYFEKRCGKNCFVCKHLDIKTDELGYPYEHECLRYGDAINPADILLDKQNFALREYANEIAR